MNGRDLERMAQMNKNWAKTGFSQSKPTSLPKKTTEPVSKVEEKLIEKRPEKKVSESKNCINAIKIDGTLMSIRKFENPDINVKLNCDLLEFMFFKYSQYGLLPIDDLVDFINKNDLKKYLE